VEDKSSGSTKYLFIIHRGVLTVPCGPTPDEFDGLPHPCIAAALTMLEKKIGVPYEYSSQHIKHVPINPCICDSVQFHVVGLDGLEGMLQLHQDDWWKLRTEQDISEVMWLTPDEVLEFAIGRPSPVAIYILPILGELFGIFDDPERPFPMQGLVLQSSDPEPSAPALGEPGDSSLNEEHDIQTPLDGQQRARGLSHA
jgi:hypothetical protein